MLADEDGSPMTIMQWISFTIVLVLLLIHGIWPVAFVLDKLSMLLLLLLAIPLLAPFLKKAKWFGAEFEFKDEIKKAKEYVIRSESQAREKFKALPLVDIRFETIPTSTARRLASEDPNLSLAALRIDMERVLVQAVERLVPKAYDRRLSIIQSAKILMRENLIVEDQAEAILSITKICNKAVHGATVTEEEAGQVLELAVQLNRSFPTGYSVNLLPNEKFPEHGLVCEWEHCIEQMPLGEEETELSCRVFGHDCPGGAQVRRQCNKTHRDIPSEKLASYHEDQ
jgi:hypothetical protein